MEVIIIRKIFSLFLVLVVITSISFTAFAAGEQPSGSNYQYRDYGTHTGYDTFWVAANKNLQYIGNYVYNSSNYLFTLQSLVSDIKLAVDPSSSPAYSTPSGQNYNYYSFSDVLLTSNFWDAVNLQLQYISNRLNSINDYQSNISSTVSGMDSLISSIVTNTSNIYSNTSDMRTFLNTFNTQTYTNKHAYISSDARVSQGNSNLNFWQAVTISLSYIGVDINAMRTSLSNLESDIDDLHSMFASPEDLALKEDQENNISAVTSNFLSGSDSATSVGTGSIGKVKDLGDDVSSFFDTGVQATSLFDSLSDTSSDGPWLWFSSAVKDNLSGSQSRSNTKSSNIPGEQVVDFYSDKMAALNNLLGEVSEDD